MVDSTGAPVNDTSGGNSTTLRVSAYEVYSPNFGSCPDKVFKAQDSHPFVAGEFVWSGFDYLGEPTPYYDARSSYFGIIDLAGFTKDRFFLYQARWRPDLRMAHSLPHWTWSDRLGLLTPVHVFSSGDRAELFLNGKSLCEGKEGGRVPIPLGRSDVSAWRAACCHVQVRQGLGEEYSENGQRSRWA